MSTSAKRISIAAFVIVIVLAGAAYYGIQSLLVQKTAPNLPMKVAGTVSVSSEPVLVSPSIVLENGYEVIQPTIGLLQKTTKVRFESVTGSKAILPPLSIPIVDKMQVILYDKTGAALPQKGEIATAAGEKSIVILPPFALEAVSGDIVLAENFMARRLPNTARKDNIVWKAVPMEDGSFLVKKIMIAEPQLVGETYFDMDQSIRSDEYAIANPDDKLQDNAIIKAATLVQYEAPIMDAQQAARQKAREEYTASLMHAVSMSPPPKNPALPESLGCPAPAKIPELPVP